jgi:hypothetical protein
MMDKMMHTPLISLILLISLVFSCGQDGVEDQDQSKSSGTSDASVQNDAYVCMNYACACCACQANEETITPLDSHGCPSCPICVPIEGLMDLGTN